MAASRLREARQIRDGRPGKGRHQRHGRRRWRRRLTVRHLLTQQLRCCVTRLLDAPGSCTSRGNCPRRIITYCYPRVSGAETFRASLLGEGPQ